MLVAVVSDIAYALVESERGDHGCAGNRVQVVKREGHAIARQVENGSRNVRGTDVDMRVKRTCMDFDVGWVPVPTVSITIQNRVAGLARTPELFKQEQFFDVHEAAACEWMLRIAQRGPTISPNDGVSCVLTKGPRSRFGPQSRVSINVPRPTSRSLGRLSRARRAIGRDRRSASRGNRQTELSLVLAEVTPVAEPVDVERMAVVEVVTGYDGVLAASRTVCWRLQVPVEDGFGESAPCVAFSLLEGIHNEDVHLDGSEVGNIT